MGNRVSNNSSLNNSWSILRNSFIGHILNNSISVVSIVDSLDSSIRKSNSVAARGCISISGLSLLEVSSTVVIIDSIVISIYWGLSKIRGSIARGSNKGAQQDQGKHSQGQQQGGQQGLLQQQLPGQIQGEPALLCVCFKSSSDQLMTV